MSCEFLVMDVPHEDVLAALGPLGLTVGETDDGSTYVRDTAGNVLHVDRRPRPHTLLTRYGTNDPNGILTAIQEHFKACIVVENDAEFDDIRWSNGDPYYVVHFENMMPIDVNPFTHAVEKAAEIAALNRMLSAE